MHKTAQMPRRYRIEGRDVAELVLVTALRELGAQRISGEARIGERRVFAKIFAGADSARAEREAAAARAALLAGIPTAKALETVALTDVEPPKSRYAAALFEWIADGEPLDRALQAAAPDRRELLIARTADLLARIHAAGFVHDDPHPANFLVVGDSIVCVDAPALVKAPLILPAARRRRGWFALGAALPPWCDESFARASMRHGLAGAGAATTIVDGIMEHRRELQDAFETKMLRSSSRVALSAGRSGNVLTLRAAGIDPRTLDLGEFIFQSEPAAEFGDDVEGTGAELLVGGRRYFGRDFAMVRTLFGKRFWPVRAAAAFGRGLWLAARGAPCLRPVAMLEASGREIHGAVVLYDPIGGVLLETALLEGDEPERFAVADALQDAARQWAMFGLGVPYALRAARYVDGRVVLVAAEATVAAFGPDRRKQALAWTIGGTAALLHPDDPIRTRFA